MRANKVSPLLGVVSMTWLAACTGGSPDVTGAAGTSGQAGTSGGAGTTGAAGTGTTGAAGTSATGAAGTSATGTAGSTGAGGAAPTAGCNAATWPPSNDQSGSTPLTLDVSGTMREFFVNVPANYSPSKATRVVFAWHALGGTARQIVGNIFGGPYYGLKSKLTDAIFISAQGLPDTSGTNMGTSGWQNTSGRDVAFARALLAWLDANYCVDKARIFSIGFSYGAIMTDNLGCQLGSALRAIAPVAGGMFGGARSCVNQRVASIMTHGSADDQVAISSGMSARDYFMAQAHCTTTSMPLGTNCVEYTGCDAGYPSAWCEHTGGHTVPSWVAAEAATFFMRF